MGADHGISLPAGPGMDIHRAEVAAVVRGDFLQHREIPGIPEGGLTSSLTFLVIAIVGTTIAQWQLFFQQSCIADKRLRFADVKWARLDTLIGATFTIVVAACMMIAGNAARVHGISFSDPAQMASDLRCWRARRSGAGSCC